MATHDLRIPRDYRGEIGRTGVLQFSGYLYEDALRELQQWSGQRIYREMADGDPIVGSVLFAIEQLIRQVEWTVEPADRTASAEDAAQLVDEALGDMAITWQDTLSEILSMLTFGWSYLEQVYKVRGGDDDDPARASKYDDGRIGWSHWGIRAQETLLRWEFDPGGTLLGMWQLPPPDYRLRFIPIGKSLHFRTTSRKGNPEGFALALDTPVPSPDGWTTMGALRVGDRVFDEQGDIRHVVAVSPVWKRRPCYRLTFTDGSSIVADENHLWATSKVWERAKGAPVKVRSTAEIAQTVKNSNGISNHGIAWAAPLRYPPQALLIDPYVLGLWLGDGSRLTADIACHADDADETVRHIESSGYLVSPVAHSGPEGCKGRSIRVSGGFQARLRVLGVLGNKHIPPGYLRGSVDQRIDLLQGLLDSDGTIDTFGRCCFFNTNHTLIDGVAELVRSLGVGCVIRQKKVNNPNRLPMWQVKFTPCSFAPFRLRRKQARIKSVRAREQHYIVSADAVAPTDTVCIEVDSPSHLFLAGTAMVPTHNSLLRRAYSPWYYKSNIQRIEAIGIERDLAGLPVVKVPGELFESPAMSAQLQVYKDLVTNLRADEQSGVVIPSDYDPASGKPMYELSLLSTGGARQTQTDPVIARYDQRIASSMLADFILLGQEKVGSYALSHDKTTMFNQALGTFLDQIAAVVNRFAIPRLLRLNGLDVSKGTPELKHGDVTSPDLAALGTFLQALANAGMNVAGMADGKWLLEQAGVPTLQTFSGPDQPDTAPPHEQQAAKAQAQWQTPPPPPPPGQDGKSGEDGDGAQPKAAGEARVFAEPDLPPGHWVTMNGAHVYIPDGRHAGPGNTIAVEHGEITELRPHPSTPEGQHAYDPDRDEFRYRRVGPEEVRPGDIVETAKGRSVALHGQAHAFDPDNFAGTITRDRFGPNVGRQASVHRSEIISALRAESKPARADQPEQVFKITPSDRRRALEDYTHTTDSAVNGYLRQGNDPYRPARWQAEVARQAQALDAAMAKAPALKRDLTVYRGIDHFGLAALGIRAGDRSLVGRSFTDAGFVSTSGSPTAASGFADAGAILEITVPKGARVMPLGALSHFADEDEHLLGRGGSFRVDAVETQGGRLAIKVTYTPASMPGASLRQKVAGETPGRLSRYVWTAGDIRWVDQTSGQDGKPTDDKEADDGGSA